MTKKERKFIHWKNSEKPRRREFLRLFAWGINWGWVYEIFRLHFVPLRMTNELLFLSKFRSTLFKGLWGVGAKPQGLKCEGQKICTRMQGKLQIRYVAERK